MGRPGHVHRGGAASSSRFGFSEFFIAEERVTVELLPVRDRRAHTTRRSSSSPRRSPTRPSTSSSGTASTARSSARTPTASPSSSTSTATSSTRTGRRCSTGSSTSAPSTCARTRATSPALVRGVTVYMVVIEGMLALTAARFMIKSLKERGWFPGFVQGFTAVNRDESRHVGFGVKFLADAIKDDQANAQDRRGDAEGVPAGRPTGVRAAVGRRSVRLPDALLPLVARSSSTRRSRCRRSSRRWASTRRCSPRARPLERPAAAAGTAPGPGGPPPARASGSSRPRSRS